MPIDTTTDLELKNAIAMAKATGKPTKTFDGGGLFLFATPQGGKLWRLKYRFGGKEKLLSLGVYPDVPLKAARVKRNKAREQLAAGIDPGALRKEAKAAVVRETVQSARTFEVVAEEWLAKQASKRSDTTMQKARWMLTAFVYPSIGARPLDAVETSDLLACLRTLEARGKLETARRLHQRMNAIFRYAAACDYVRRNPAADLRGALEPPVTTHRAAITEPAKIGALLRAIDDFDGYLVTGFALRLSALTFKRPGEIRGAQWSEFDFTENVWRIDAKRMKMKAAHDVPLSRQALELLNELKPLSGSGRLLFPGVRSVERPISENTLNAALRTMGISGKEHTAHGFRAMATTRLNEMGQLNREAIFRALSHKEPNKTRAAYDRSEHWPERVKIMQVWADYLDTLRTGGNVITGKFGRAA